MEFTHHLLHLVLLRNLQNLRHIAVIPQTLQRQSDMLTCDRLLCLLLRNLIGLTADQSDELDAAFYKEVACFAREGDSRIVRENFGDNLLDSRLRQGEVVGTFSFC